MEQILPAYNDPLFSILLIVIISLIISLVTYGWGLYHKQKEEGNLLKFLEKFDSTECALDTANMPFEPHMLKPFTLLAKAFESAGEYPKAINIYIYLIKHIQNESGNLELMECLGDTYLHAGFLERSMLIYLEILRKKPRNIRVLYHLGIVYESLHQFTKVKDVLEPLKTLGEKTDSLERFINFSILVANKELKKEEKVKKLMALLQKDASLYRSTIKAIFKLDSKSAWILIDEGRIKEIIDILWFLPESQLDLDIIASNKSLETLYYAKGYIEKPTCGSHIFSLDMLATAKKSGFKDGDLLFSYLCTKCKQSFPVSFRRCPNCMTLNSVKVEEQVAKSTPQTNYSLL